MIPDLVTPPDHCRRGHANATGRRYCHICGIAMVQASVIAPADVARPAPAASLTLTDGPTWPIGASLVIGRTDGAVRLDMAGVSGAHAELCFDGMSVTVLDLESTNGTFVAIDGRWQRVPARARFPIRSGDHVAFGPATATIAVT